MPLIIIPKIRNVHNVKKFKEMIKIIIFYIVNVILYFVVHVIKFIKTKKNILW